METTIRPLAVLIFIAVRLLAAPISYAGHSSFMGAAVFGQGRGNKGETGDSSKTSTQKKCPIWASLPSGLPNTGFTLTIDRTILETPRVARQKPRSLWTRQAGTL